MKSKLITIAIILQLCYSLQSKAQCGFSIFVEEDNFNKKFDKDQNYTGGGAITLFGDYTKNDLFLSSFFLRNIDTLIDATRIGGRSPDYLLHTFAFGTSIFTPQKLDTIDPMKDDRPYSNLTFISSRKTRVYKNTRAEDYKSVSTEFNIGIIGSNLGNYLQTYIHDHHIRKDPTNPRNRPIPLGWRNQISDGGEPTLMYKILVQNRWLENNVLNYHWLQLSSMAEGTLGYYTSLAAGLSLRVGLFHTQFWQNNSNFGNSVNSLTSSFLSNNSQSWVQRNCEIYAFASNRVRFMAHNVLLRGQFKSSKHTLRADQVKYLIDEFEVGIAARVWWLNFTWEPIAGRTTEINTPLSRTHIWAAFNFALLIPIGN